MPDWHERLERFFAEQLPSAESVRIAAVRPMPAGASNDTASMDLRVRCEGIEWTMPVVVRPERRHGILAPYDVAKQFRVLRSLAHTPIPVPAAFWYCDDLDILGAPFYVMERIRGDTLPVLWYGGRSPRLLAAAEALATVHAVDWRRAGLEFLVQEDRRSADPVRGEIAAWRRRAAGSPIAGATWFVALADYLIRSQPADAALALLHGDPNPGNYLFQADKVVAVLDWELAAIGDPRSDLGFYAALATTFGGMTGHQGASVLSDAYHAVTGIHLTNLAYYEALGLYRMAALLAASRGAFSYYGMDSISRRLAELLGPRWEG